MRLSDKISLCVQSLATAGTRDIVLPNFFMGHYEADVIKITGSDYVIEYEIKISRSDYFADFKKGFRNWRNKVTTLKHDMIKSGDHTSNRFYFVVPKGLIDVSECPKHAGLIVHDGVWLQVVKPAPLLHKRKFTDYKSIVNTLAWRERNLRQQKRISNQKKNQ